MKIEASPLPNYAIHSRNTDFFSNIFKAFHGVELTATQFPFSIQFDKPTDVNAASSSLSRFRLLCTC
jgi:hypothetical protein